MNLSWKIAGVLSGDLPESVLDTYEVERKPHARALIRLAKLIGASMTRGGEPVTCSAGLSPRGCTGSPAVRDRLLDSETPPLCPSALVEGRRPSRSLNGRLCPNALLADDLRYDDVTRGGFVFVTGDRSRPSSGRCWRSRGTEVLEVEPGSPLGKWLADGKAAAALVRPDFTVLRAGRDVAALCEAAPRFLVARRASPRDDSGRR